MDNWINHKSEEERNFKDTSKNTDSAVNKWTGAYDYWMLINLGYNFIGHNFRPVTSHP